MKIFLHGLESSSRGSKAAFLQQRFPGIIIPDFQGSLTERMTSLNAVLAGHKHIILAGSSFGGLMAVIYAMAHQDTVVRIVLLAPALNFPEFSGYALQRLDIPAWMFIGRADSVTPAAHVVPVAEKIFAELHYHEVEDDHMLAKTFRTLDWDAMLAE